MKSTQFVSGRGAIRTHSGLAWLTVRADTSGNARVRFDDAARHVHLLAMTGLQAVFGTNSVLISGAGISVLVQKIGALERVAIHTSRVKTSGKVVRGGFDITV